MIATALATCCALGSGLLFAAAAPAAGVAPTVEGLTASGVTPFAVTLEAQVDPESEPATCEFDYGTTTAYGTEVACEPGATLEGEAQPASVRLTGLTAGTLYYYKLVVRNAAGEAQAEGEAMTLTVEKPTVYSEGVSGITPFQARLEGALNPDSQETTYSFEYSTKGSTTGDMLAGAITTVNGESAIPPEEFGERGVGVPTGRVLAPATTYYYRFVASNETGTTKDRVESFTTPAPESPIVNREGASGITPFEARLEGALNPDDQLTECHFQYGETAVSEHEVGCEPESLEGFGEQSVAKTVTGLALGTTYHYRVVAKNATGETEGAGEFTTRGIAPLASTGAASAVGQSSAEVTGTVNPDGAETHYYYQYGPTTEYGQSTAAEGPGVDVGAGTSAVAAPATLVPLTPGVTYHYRLVAWNEEGTSYGQDETLTAAAGQPPVASTGSASGVTVDEATISGTIDPAGKETSYRFEYGTGTEYGTQAFGTVLPEQGEQTVTLSLRGIDPDTTYHYRLVVSNPGGTSYGEDETFTTEPVAFPAIAPTPAPLIALPNIAFPTEAAARKPGKPKQTGRKKGAKKGHRKARKKARARGRKKK
ncbi:MAG: hypothetical protein ACRDLF_04665 [Solirubrobacteraceae bacterium]